VAGLLNGIDEGRFHGVVVHPANIHPDIDRELVGGPGRASDEEEGQQRHERFRCPIIEGLKGGGE
jgi:hypothetical protein